MMDPYDQMFDKDNNNTSQYKIDKLKHLSNQVTLALLITEQHPAAVQALVAAARLYKEAINAITADRLSELTDQSSSNIEDELNNLANLFKNPLKTLQTNIAAL